MRFVKDRRSVDEMSVISTPREADPTTLYDINVALLRRLGFEIVDSTHGLDQTRDEMRDIINGQDAYVLVEPTYTRHPAIFRFLDKGEGALAVAPHHTQPIPADQTPIIVTIDAKYFNSPGVHSEEGVTYPVGIGPQLYEPFDPEELTVHAEKLVGDMREVVPVDPTDPLTMKIQTALLDHMPATVEETTIRIIPSKIVAREDAEALAKSALCTPSAFMVLTGEQATKLINDYLR